MMSLRLAANRQSLLVKEARFARVLELWHSEHLSTRCIAGMLDLNEADVCRMIEEGESQSWRDRRVAR
ncbi:hypothetical protein [Rhizobium sp. LC145]|uniref:hypothetical protein n=1 Tax=Rhizobium sp. LC145 TaxID=1120688 RepID=UPI00062A210D|nr:hypothetical protein [Rhizobium sp. LC145]KKX28246.1 hypothetical protein YH62_19355 [Rhizobium sp. LC145]TKT58336.1 hypothetical protein FDR95_12060 [Rhizobiaceae bacterium LC148]